MMELKPEGYAEVATKTVDNLVIKKGRVDLAKIVIATKGDTLKRGMVLYYSEGDGGSLNATASGDACAILAEDVVATTDYEEVTAEVYLSGVFNAKVICEIMGSVQAKELDALRARDIYIQSPAD